LKDNARVYLCGEGGGMGAEIKETIGKIWKEDKGWGDPEMKTWMKDENYYEALDWYI
jgi:sulfite reductase alpha subunit-like flavoprotein